VLEDSEEGNILRSTTERNTQSTQVRGSRKEITPLLLHYCLYKSRSMERTTMVLPSSLLEEEDALLTMRQSSDQPLARAPCATLYSDGQVYNGHLQEDDTDYSPNRTR
jgi:hypothetical protein